MSHFIRVKQGLGGCCCYQYQHILNTEDRVHLAHGSLDGSIDFTVHLGNRLTSHAQLKEAHPPRSLGREMSSEDDQKVTCPLCER